MLRRRLLYPLAVLVLLGQMAFAMVTTAIRQAPTIDEPVYVATADVYAQQHSLQWNPEHPPLGKLAMAVGLAFDDARADPAYQGTQQGLGRKLLYESGNNPFRLMLLARLPIIVLTLLFGLVVLFFARDLAGSAAGLIGLALYAFSPDVIAHGSLATLDVPAAGLLLTAFWLLWRSRRQPGLYLPLAGLALGAALATRMSALPAVPMVLGLALLSPLPIYLTRQSGEEPEQQPRRRWWREIGLRVLVALGVGAIAVAVVWITYLAVDPHLRWTPPAGLRNPGGLRGHAVDLLPLPKAYRDGVLIQFKFEAKSFNGFLLGKQYKGSAPWYYLPVALLIKTPLGMLALWLAGTVTTLIRPALRWATLYLLVPAGLLMLVAMTGARPYGTRYVIFMPIFLAVISATVLVYRAVWVRAVVVALTAFVAFSSLRTFPYYIQYSNEAFGGTANTHNNLHDANVDWGQDLSLLGPHLRDKYPGQQVWLVYKGSGVPSYYGIRAKSPFSVPDDQVHGLLVVSDSRVALATGRLKQLIDSSRAIDQVGYSITIYQR